MAEEKFRNGSRRPWTTTQIPVSNTPALSQLPAPISQIKNDAEVSISADKFARTTTIYTWWEYKNIAEEPLYNDVLIA